MDAICLASSSVSACDSLETSESHVFGDVILCSEPMAVEALKRSAKRR